MEEGRKGLSKGGGKGKRGREEAWMERQRAGMEGGLGRVDIAMWGPTPSPTCLGQQPSFCDSVSPAVQ